MNTKIKITILWLLLGVKAIAAEGMWMPDEKGELSLPLRNATVKFNDMCSGVIVSSEGLFLTNHHCALEAVQKQSTPARNLLQDGFSAEKWSDEISIPELNVKRLLYTLELTDRMECAVSGIEDEFSCISIIDSIIRSVCDSIENDSPFITAAVQPFYEGNRWFLNVYEVFRDIRLVLVPPHSIAAFGGETDNWTWPRCSADFAFLRIYTGQENQPAYYSQKNRPLNTTDYAKISMQGYDAADTVMTVGFPGDTRRYSTSWEVEAIKENENAPRIEVKAKKLAYWKTAMERDPVIKFAYLSKYSQCANFFKYAQGMNRCIDSLSVVEERQTREELLLSWISENFIGREMYLNALSAIKNGVVEKMEEQKALSYLIEALADGPEIVGLALAFMALDLKGDKEAPSRFLKVNAYSFYKGYNAELDKALMTEMLALARERIPAKYLPSVYNSIQVYYADNISAYVENMFKKTVFRTEKTIKKALQNKKLYLEIEKDPLYDFAFSVQMAYYDLLLELSGNEYECKKASRILFGAWEMCDPSRTLYSDANFTMRKSFGTVKALPSGNFYTTPRDLLEKNLTHSPEYFLSPKLKSFFENAPDSLHLCLISDNDITGGNSGSPLFNAGGELIGLAFDGNWEGMSGDLLFGSEQRAIHVDVRYILFWVKNWANAENIYQEITTHR